METTPSNPWLPGPAILDASPVARVHAPEGVERPHVRVASAVAVPGGPRRHDGPGDQESDTGGDHGSGSSTGSGSHGSTVARRRLSTR